MEGEALARGRLEILRMFGDELPERWPGCETVAEMRAHDIGRRESLAERETKRLAQRIDAYAARSWATIFERNRSAP